MKGAFYFIDSEEAAWNTGEPGLGYKVRVKGGYFPVAPTDTMTDIRNEMCQLLERCGIRVERHHHEVATAGQGEINFRFDTLTRAADNLLLFKYIVRNVAKKYGKTATFMPKPIVGDNGSGMHTHQSLFNGDTPLFYEKGGYANLSELALYYIGGILKHAPALTAPLPPCCSPAWTASATGSIQPNTASARSTRTSTSCRTKRRRTSRACRLPSTKRWTLWKKTTRSCLPAMSSRRMSSRRGSP